MSEPARTETAYPTVDVAPGRAHRQPPRRRRRHRRAEPRTTMPAGRAIAVAVTALLVAALLDSRAMVSAGRAMRPGLTRDVVLAIAVPVDAVAGTVGLDRPRAAVDAMLGRHPTGSAALPHLPQLPSASAAPAPDRSHRAHGRKRRTAQPSRAQPPTPTPVRVVTPARPLRLFVAGDSLVERLGPAVVSLADAHHRTDGSYVPKYGTGLVRLDAFDWLAYARQEMAARHPEAVVVMMGGNEGQPMPSDHGVLAPASAAWVTEYERRARAVMTILAGDGRRRVYWVGMPPARSSHLTTDFAAVDRALRAAAATVPGVTYVDVWGLLSDHGRYADYLPGADGRPVLVRASDGIHLSADGAMLVARQLVGLLDRDYRVLGHGG